MGSKVKTTWPRNSCVRARQHKYFVRQGKVHLPTCRKIWQVTWFWLWIPSNVPRNLTFAIFYKITSWFGRSRGLQFGSHQKSPNISLLKYFIPGLSKSNFIIKCNRGQLQGVEQRSIEELVNLLGLEVGTIRQFSMTFQWPWQSRDLASKLARENSLQICIEVSSQNADTCLFFLK